MQARCRSRVGLRWLVGVIAGLLFTAGGASAASFSETPLASGPPLLGGPHVPGAGGKFAGYLRYGNIRSIGGAWTVPTVAGNSRVGLGSTWIGAQAPGAQLEGPFIQIGLNEEQTVNPLTGAGPPAYYAFWSSTDLHFSPVTLFSVQAGDRITASMRLAGGRWTLAITDLTSGAHRRFSTRQETNAHDHFNLAEWLQEDVTDGATNAAFPYPDISPTQWTAMRLDGTTPTYEQVLSTWMALPGGYLGPTRLHDGRFSIPSVRLSAQGAAYLRIADPVDIAGNVFAAEEYGWSTSTPLARIEAESDAYQRRLAAALRRYRAGHWPAIVAPQIRRLIAHAAYLVDRLDASASHGATAVRTLFETAATLHPYNSATIRRLLGVQQIGY